MPFEYLLWIIPILVALGVGAVYLQCAQFFKLMDDKMRFTATRAQMTEHASKLWFVYACMMLAIALLLSESMQAIFQFAFVLWLPTCAAFAAYKLLRGIALPLRQIFLHFAGMIGATTVFAAESLIFDTGIAQPVEFGIGVGVAVMLGQFLRTELQETLHKAGLPALWLPHGSEYAGYTLDGWMGFIAVYLYRFDGHLTIFHLMILLAMVLCACAAETLMQLYTSIAARLRNHK